MMHTLTIGAPQTGKSTLIQRVIRALDCPVSGFITKKEDALSDPVHGSPIFLYPVGMPRVQTPDNLLGYSKAQHLTVFPEAFDRFAPLLEVGGKSGLILMDELGVMENASESFRAAVLRLLDRETPILAAVKEKNTEFLQAVRSHPNCRCFFLTAENREDLYPEVLQFVKNQL